jgi:ribonuclease R
MKKKNKILGTFRANERGFGFVEIGEDEDDIFIMPKNIHGALNGDKVEVILEKPKTKDKRAEGKIVKVVEREKKEVVGIFQKSRSFGFVVPDDKKFGTDIFISKANWKNAKNNDKVVATILKYPEKGKNAEGEIKEVLGKANAARNRHVIFG